jgi:putative hydrolase of the HAD superfamily
MKYKHYSFDLWMTLIKSNPLFKEERAKYFFQKHNKNQKTLEDIKNIFRKIDLVCTAISEKTGSHLASEDLYLMVLHEIAGDFTYFKDINLKELESEMEEIVWRYSPELFSTVTLKSLEELKEKTGASFSLLSNTAFIKGKTLRIVLAKLGLGAFFEFQLYSDEAGMSKPCLAFFNQMIQQAQSIHKQDGLSLQEILHVGDNPVADAKGAQDSGIACFLINSNGKTISDLS